MDSESFVREYFHVSNPEAVKWIAERLQVRKFAKGDMLAEPGKKLTEVCFLISGTAIAYAYGDDGNRSVPCIENHTGGVLAPDLEWLSDKPSTQWVEVMYETEAYALSVEDFRTLKEKFPREISDIVLHYSQISMEWYLKHKIMLAMPAKKRVEWFEKNYANTHLKMEDIASYLNMTREHYSKIRASLTDKE